MENRWPIEIDGLPYTGIYLGKFHHGLTVLPNTGIMGIGFGKSSPAMAELFRWVNYYNLPRWMIYGNFDIPSGYLLHSRDIDGPLKYMVYLFKMVIFHGYAK